VEPLVCGYWSGGRSRGRVWRGRRRRVTVGFGCALGFSAPLLLAVFVTATLGDRESH
jgi:hypothetical protein